jgi:hypothetical protein
MRQEPATGAPGESLPHVRGLVLPVLLASLLVPADGSTLEMTCSAGHCAPADYFLNALCFDRGHTSARISRLWADTNVRWGGASIRTSATLIRWWQRGISTNSSLATCGRRRGPRTSPLASWWRSAGVVFGCRAALVATLRHVRWIGLRLSVRGIMGESGEEAEQMGPEERVCLLIGCVVQVSCREGGGNGLIRDE